MSDDLDSDANVDADDEPQFEMSPQEATNLSSRPPQFNRKKVWIVITASLALLVGVSFLSLIISSSNNNSSSSSDDEYAAHRSSQSDFISSLQRRAANQRDQTTAELTADIPVLLHDEPEQDIQSLLPAAAITRNTSQPVPAAIPPPAPSVPQSPQPAQVQQMQQPQQQQRPTHYGSSLVPTVQGSLFSQGMQPQMQSASSQNPSSFAADYFANYASNSPLLNQSVPAAQNNPQNNQQNQPFYDPSSGGDAVYGGHFIGDNALWIGTIIPGILQTAISTDMPGNVLARVTQNVFDSRTGRTLLIPQGTLLIARYNSSVSYAQNRVQIVWDTLIRPDGYQINLEGAPGVDLAGMTGQPARYHENWFEYLKAAGIILLFSIANSRLAETAATRTSEASAESITESTTQFVNQLGQNIITRAMDISPKLTVENGTLINIMLNRTIYLPPVDYSPVTNRYILE